MTELAADAPADVAAPRNLRWWKEVAYGVAVYAVYWGVRNRFGSASGDPGPAFEHAREIIDVEKWLHLYVEPHVQEWYLGLPGRGLIRGWNVYYGLAHFVVTLAALVVLFRRGKDQYPLWRNTLAFTTCLAVVGFAAYSLMPPRLLDDPGEFGACQIYAPAAASELRAAGRDGAGEGDGCDEYGYVDTVDRYGGWISFGNEGYKDVSNQYAAMPSMHIGWSTWVAIVLLPVVRRRWVKALVLLHPTATLFCIVVTANHYWIDGVGGLLCLAAGYGLARAVTGRIGARPTRGSRGRRSPAPPRP